MIIENYAEQYCLKVSGKIKEIIKSKKLTQTKVVELCENAGVPVSQGTISNITRGAKEIKLSSLISLCKGLNINIIDILSDDDTENKTVLKYDDKMYKGYTGTYHTYFFPTISNKEELLHGILDINEPNENGKCEADLKLYTGEKKKDGERDEEIIKYYTGEFAISGPMQSAYCLLNNSQTDEQCCFIFHHFYILNNELKCRVAAAVTTSAGGNRRPTIHRIYISRDKLSVEGEKYIRGQLRLNESEILINKNAYAELLATEEIPQEFTTVFKKEAKVESYYNVVEARLSNCGLKKEEFARVISLLRDYSVAPKYNKVSMKTDEFVFDNYENWKEKCHQQSED